MSHSNGNIPCWRCDFCQKVIFSAAGIGQTRSIQPELCFCPHSYHWEYNIYSSNINIQVPKTYFEQGIYRRYFQYMKRLSRRKQRFYAKKELRDIKKYWNDSKTLPEYLMATKKQPRRLDGKEREY